VCRNRPLDADVTRDLDIRRPDLLGVRRLGTVRWFKDERGYGRITADDGEVLFVHWSAIIEREGFRELQQGQRVSFVWDGAEGDHGRHSAAQVRLEDRPSPASGQLRPHI
jgi:cold shock CspA family protein